MAIPENQTPTNPTTPPAATQNSSTTTPPAVTTPENLSQSTTPPSGSSSDPAKVDPPPANANPGEPATPPAPAPAEPPAVPAEQVPAPQEYDIEVEDSSPLSQEELDAIADYASKHNLTKEEAQGLVATQEKLYQRGQQTAENVYKQKIETMKTTMQSHPDFAPEKKAATWSSINKAVQTFGSPALVEAFKDPEHGYNLEIALFLKNIGDALGPEILPGQGTGGGGKPVKDNSEAARLQRNYPGFFETKK